MILPNCIFCDIVSGKENCYPIFEDETAKAFLTIYPISEGHTLVIPKKHYEMIFDIPDEELSHINQVAKMLCSCYKQKIGINSVNLLVSNGKATNQKIMHFHLHIIPRRENDGVVIFPTESKIENPNLEQAQKLFATEK